MKKALVILSLLFLSGCVTFRDSSGNVAPKSDEFDCKQKCGYYERNRNEFIQASCMIECMESKGYSTKNKKQAPNHP